ncbi:MAG: AEC family transporter [Acetatifactor sp.]|nr:AEC family transporter [Acetatifactor sp.]
MKTTFIFLNQTVLMFLLAGIGYILYKRGKITKEGSKTIGNILINLVLPGVIIQSFLVERTAERVVGLALSAVLAAVILLLSVFISGVFLKRDPIASFAGAFSNPGFFGVPLIAASLTDRAVFYIASFIAFLNLLQWSYGVAIMTGKSGRITMKRLLTAPFFIAIVIGFLLFVTQIPLPGLLTKALHHVTALNTPLAMFVVGVYLAQTDLAGMFRKKYIYKVCFIRLVMIPVLTLAVLMLVPPIFYEMKMAILIASACPVGTNVAIYAQLHNQDYPYAVETVVISTLLSIVTIPAIMTAAEMLFL